MPKQSDALTVRYFNALWCWLCAGAPVISLDVRADYSPVWRGPISKKLWSDQPPTVIVYLKPTCSMRELRHLARANRNRVGRGGAKIWKCSLESNSHTLTHSHVTTLDTLTPLSITEALALSILSGCV